MVTGRRNTSTVAPQALFFMNHPFVMEQATLTARGLLAQKLPSDAALADRLYRRVLGRLPTTTERQIALDYVQEKSKAAEPDGVAAWSAIVQSLLASPDFRYVE
jgi:hypothetical protein